MKILHTGDVHLDSPFAGLDPQKSEERRRETRDTFSRMMAFAAENAVDMVIIAGDLFDAGFVTRETVALLIRDFSRLSCPVIITPGNHDPADAGSVWLKNILPENVYVFTSEELSYFSFDELNCDVYGCAFTSRTMRSCPVENMIPRDENRINILACHGDTTSPISSSCPLPQGALEAFGADYTALGHIHNPEAANNALTVRGCYCGCPEGRDFGETGAKGAVLVNIDKSDVRTVCEYENIRFCKRIYECRTVNVDGASSMDDICAAVRGVCEREAFDGDTLLRVTLAGSVEPSLVIDTSLAASAAEGLFWTEVCDATSPTWNAEFLKNDKGIRGEVYRTLLPGMESADGDERQKSARALRYALAALAGEDLGDR